MEVQVFLRKLFNSKRKSKEERLNVPDPKTVHRLMYAARVVQVVYEVLRERPADIPTRQNLERKVDALRQEGSVSGADVIKYAKGLLARILQVLEEIEWRRSQNLELSSLANMRQSAISELQDLAIILVSEILLLWKQINHVDPEINRIARLLSFYFVNPEEALRRAYEAPDSFGMMEALEGLKKITF